MNDRKNKLFNLNFYNEKINNSCMIETNINNDCEDSDKSLSLDDNHHICIPYLIENILNIEKKNKLGRKRKIENNDDDNNDSGGHDKFKDDNVRRKIKHLIFSHLKKYINNQIKIKYNGKIGKGIFKKELLTLNQEQTANTND